MNSSFNNQDTSSHEISFNDDTTKQSTSLLNASHETYHSIEEVNNLLEDFHMIKNKNQDFLSREEHEEDIKRLEQITENLLNFTEDDPTLLNYINEADKLRDTKNYLKLKEAKHFATYNKYTDNEPETDDNGNILMTKTFINKLLCTNGNLYYRTHELNDILYLHFKGFRKIENITTFINLKVLYLESNCIKKIEGLEELISLTGLYLQENMIDKIEGLNTLKFLSTLNLSDNRIKKIENLSDNLKLNTILLKRNFIGQENEDLSGLLELSPSVSVIDISDNRITNENIIDDYLVKVPGLKVLYLFGNDCTRKIPNYINI